MAKFRPISLDEFRSAQESAESDQTPYATEASFDRAQDAIQLTLSNGVTIMFGRSHIASLKDIENVTGLKTVEIEGGGSILAFPRLDVYLSVGPLVEQFLAPMMDWARRERRAAASRENGKKGGRPKNTEATEANESVHEAAL